MGVVGQLVFDIQVGIRAGSPIGVRAPGLCGPDVVGRAEGIVYEKGPVGRIEVLQGVVDRRLPRRPELLQRNIEPAVKGIKIAGALLFYELI